MTIFFLGMSILIAYIIIREISDSRKFQREILIELKDFTKTSIFYIVLFIISVYPQFKNIINNPSTILELDNMLLILICIEGIVGLIITPDNKFGVIHDGIYFNKTLYKWDTIKTYEFVKRNRLDIWFKVDKDYIFKFKYKPYQMEELKEIVEKNVVVDPNYKF